LAPEKLRGVGGILLDNHGRRFVNELATRDIVATAILKQADGKALLLLGDTAAKMFGLPAIDFYCSRGLFQKSIGAKDTADMLKVSESELEAQLRIYNAAVESGLDADFGRVCMPTTFNVSGPFYVAQVEPVVHYTMGGVRIDTEGRVLREDGSVVEGLFAAGEVTGGVHGTNRLAGNSLLECCVFGQRAGRSAAAAAMVSQ